MVAGQVSYDQVVCDVVRTFFGVSSEHALTAGTRLIDINDDPEEAVDFLNALEKVLDGDAEYPHRDISAAEFQALCARADATLGDVARLVESSPVLTIDYIVRKQCGACLTIDDPDLVGLELKLEVSPERWMKLREDLNRALAIHHVVIEVVPWKNLGRGKEGDVRTHRVPVVDDVLRFVQDEYTADIA